MKRLPRPIPVVMIFVLALLGTAGTIRADTRLYLKDGTFQIVKSYEVKGDRVRYYSVERSAWEEIPLSLVDFAATERAQQEEKALHKRQEAEAQKIDHERVEVAESTGVEVAPGVRLPGEEGVFAWDGQRLARMIQSSGEVVTDRKRAALLLALPGPVLKNRAYVVLPGPAAAVRLMSTQPVFYVQASDALGAKLELVTVKSRKDSRQVEKVEWRAGITKPAELRAAVPLARKEIAPGVFQLTLAQPLDPGEYALGELVQQKLNLELWDFGIVGAPSHATSDTEPPPRIQRAPEKSKD